MYEGQLTEEERLSSIQAENDILTYLTSVLDSADEYKKAWKLREAQEEAEYKKKQLIEEKQKYKAHPDLMLVWNPGMGDDIVYTIDRWVESEPCANCGNIGSYRLSIEPKGPGVCRADIDNKKDETNLAKRDILKVIELPYAHQFVNSCSVDEFDDVHGQ